MSVRVLFAYLLLLVAGGARAQEYAALLNGAAAEPPNASAGAGNARISVFPATQSLRVEATFSGLASGTTRAHVHCCVAAPGVAAVAAQGPTLDQFPTAVAAGSYQQLFDLTAAATFDPAFIAAHGGTPATAATTLLAGLANGQAYVDIETAAVPTGEIRGFLQATGGLFADGYESTAATSLSLLRCDSPTNGALVDAAIGAGIPLSGTALGLSSIDVNGAPVALAANRTFATSVTARYGLNIVALTGVDALGATRTATCAFIAAQRWVNEGADNFDALPFRLQQPGLTKLTSVYPAWFARPELAQFVDTTFLAGNPFYQAGCGTNSCVRELRYLSQSFSLRPQPGGVNISYPNPSTMRFVLSFDVTLHERVRVQFVGGVLQTRDGDVVFASPTVTVDVSFGVVAATGVPLIAVAGASFSSSGVATTGFTGFDANHIATITTESTNALQAILVPEIGNGCANLFSGLFAGMDVTLPPAGWSVPRLDGSGNVTVDVARRSSVSLPNQSLRVDNALRITQPAPPVSATGRIPVPFVAQVPPRPAFDGFAAVSAGTFNQVAQALWRVGAFDGTVDGAALGGGLPPGTSLFVQSRAQPVLASFDTNGFARFDVGPIDLVATHPGLPPWLRASVSARVRAQVAYSSGDIVFSAFAVDELMVSTGGVALATPAQATLQDLAQRLVSKVAGVALNDGVPAFPETIFTILPALGAYGLTPGQRLINAPTFGIGADYLFMEGQVGNQ